MITLWLDVLFWDETGIMISDDTYWMQAWLDRNMKREFFTYYERYEMVVGKEITYMIAGLDNDIQAKQFAIYYHRMKANGSISKYRLD